MSDVEFVFGLPPPSTFEVTPTEEQRADFQEHGFVVIDRVTTDEELEWLAKVLDEVLEGGATFVFEPGRDLAEEGPLKIAQTIHPEIQYPELLQTTYCRNARRIAAVLLGRPVASLSTWGYMLRVRPKTGLAIPWHQDEAYWEPELAYEAVAAWLSLHPATVGHGALKFVPRSHRGEVLHHDEAGTLPRTLLVARDVGEEDAVTCEVPQGGATFHDQRTLVAMDPNRSPADVDSYIVEVQTAPDRRPVARHWPWTDHRRITMEEWDDPLIYIADGRIVPVP